MKPTRNNCRNTPWQPAPKPDALPFILVLIFLALLTLGA